MNEPYLIAGKWDEGRFERIQNAVAEAYGITVEDIRGRSRIFAIAEARQVVMFLVGRSNSEICRKMDRSWKTIDHGIKHIQDLMDAYPAFKLKVEHLKSMIDEMDRLVSPEYKIDPRRVCASKGIFNVLAFGGVR